MKLAQLIFIQWAGIAAWSSEEVREETKKNVAELKARRNVIHELVNQIPGFSAFLPPSTFYLFVNVTRAFEILNCTDYEQFRRIILEKTGVSFCTRAHFGTPLLNEKEKYIRFAYSNATIPSIKEAMGVLTEFMVSSCKENGYHKFV